MWSGMGHAKEPVKRFFFQLIHLGNASRAKGRIGVDQGRAGRSKRKERQGRNTQHTISDGCPFCSFFHLCSVCVTTADLRPVLLLFLLRLQYMCRSMNHPPPSLTIPERQQVGGLQLHTGLAVAW